MPNYPQSFLTALPAFGPASLAGTEAIAPIPGTSGTQTALTVTGAADTGVTASTEQSDVYFNLARTVTWATGALTTQRAVRIAAPTYAFAGASTITNAVTLDVSGAPTAGTNATITNAYAFRVTTGTSYFGGAVAMTPAAATSGARVALTVTTPADTGITASTEQSDVYLNLASTRTWATGALTNQRSVRIVAPTLAFAGASTVTNAATVYIDAAPTAGTNATITNAYALWVDAGTTRLDGTVLLNGAITADTTDSSGTPGNATINKASGKVAIAIGASSVTVTNSLVTTASTVIATLQFVDATLTQILSVVPGSGSFVITGNANATAATKVAFVVIN